MRDAETWTVGAEAGWSHPEPDSRQTAAARASPPDWVSCDFTATDFTIFHVRGAGFSSEGNRLFF